jgi:multicomponent Na+:H+ antiporter subunit C
MFEFINEENTAIILFFIGVYGLIARRNIIKSIMSLGIMQAAIILFFLSINAAQIPPIGKNFEGVISDPLPQALMITAVVIGMSITGVSLIMFITTYNVFKSTNWSKIKHAKEQNDD